MQPEQPERVLSTRPSAERGAATGLPRINAPLLGREREVEAARARLLRPETRLLALTGPGGIGKTRLAVQVAVELEERFPDGVHFVSLAAVEDSALVLSAIAQAVGAREAAGQALIEVVLEALAQRSILLVLDSFERVTAATAALAELLAACPGLKLLLTSRAIPHVYGEHSLEVPPLALPPRDARTPPQVLGQYAAVQLFISCSLRSQGWGGVEPPTPNSQLPTPQLVAIAELCRRLDGLPLAIELAAARGELSPVELLEQLDRMSLAALDAAPDLPDRQRTLRATIAWSHDLLTPEEQVAFRRVAVLVGGCSLDAAASVGSWELGLGSWDSLESPTPDSQLPTPHEVLRSLAAKSLLRESTTDREGPRFFMLETIREFGLERLEASGEAETVRRRHATYFLELAELAEPALQGPEQRAWMARLEREHDNLRAALEWWTAAGEGEPAWRLAGALWRFWVVRGHLREGRERLRAVLALEGPLGPARAHALNAAGNLAYNQGDYPAAEQLHRAGLELRRELGDEQGIAASLNNLGLVARRRGDYARARAFFQEAVGLNRRLGNRDWQAINLNNLGNVAYEQGDQLSARGLQEESLELFTRLGDEWGIAMALCDLGNVAAAQDDDLTARALYEESLARRRAAGNRREMASCLVGLAHLALDRTDLFGARSHLAESLATSRELEDRQGIINALEGYAALAAAMNDPRLALRLAGAAEALRETINNPPSPVEADRLARRLEPARRVLGEVVAVATIEEGRATPLTQAVATALELRGPA